MEEAIERLIATVMARDDLPRAEAERFVIILLEELEVALDEPPVRHMTFSLRDDGELEDAQW